MTPLEEILEQWRNDPSFMANVACCEVLPEQAASYADMPAFLDDRLKRALKERGIEQLYLHQAEALQRLQEKENIVVVTPTASGKTLCYNLPVLNALLQDHHHRALYLFPTKALAQDQLVELKELAARCPFDLRSYVYDGDTEPELRRAIRDSGQVVITNPDMLHTGILPHHTKWIQLFQNLKFVVIDEVHHYRGVFGSHLANVIRRLKRICSFYGSRPQFILCSATIANPGELAETLIEEPVSVISKSGAPRGKKHFIIYNPPLVNRELGIRRSALLVSRELAAALIKKGIQTIVFTRSRLGVEVLLTYLQERFPALPGRPERVKGYRGGYLPRERRSIEEGLRRGTIRGVVSTNALELGIDIGELEACILNGYPGTIAGTWQQSGRAGRRSGTSLAIMVTASDPVNQFIAANPAYFLGNSPERALINPDNLVILTNHLRCAAFELPFREGEPFGRAQVTEILEFLEEEQVLYRQEGRFYWMEDAFPAEEISLRSATRENVVIIDTSGSQPQVIGEVDRFSAPMLVHEEAIYIHNGIQYQVEKLDFPAKKAYVRPVRVNYFTDAQLSVDIKVLEVLEEEEGAVSRAWGEVRLNALVALFKKIRFNTHENIGSGPVKLPETEMHTTAFWISFSPQSLGGLPQPAVQSGLQGLTNLIPQIASLYLMSDPRDLRAVGQIKSPFNEQPTLYLYESYPGGVGYSRELYRIYKDIFRSARRAVLSCNCREGCPSCVGPPEQIGPGGKEHTLALMEVVLR